MTFYLPFDGLFNILFERIKMAGNSYRIDSFAIRRVMKALSFKLKMVISLAEMTIKQSFVISNLSG